MEKVRIVMLKKDNMREEETKRHHTFFEASIHTRYNV